MGRFVVGAAIPCTRDRHWPVRPRGAGSILGTAQSGHIMAVGFDLYCQLLKQAVAQLKQGDGPDLNWSRRVPRVPVLGFSHG